MGAGTLFTPSKFSPSLDLVVPQEQIIDTVELFHLPRQRKISLRFLSKHLLQKQIQVVTHCSVEDAKAAMDLYELYKKLKQEGTFEETLQRIYQIGRSCNWRVSDEDVVNKDVHL